MELAQVTIPQAIAFTEVTLRDGEQQQKREACMPIAARIDVFDSLVDCGMQRIEIGHLGNPADMQLASAIVAHIDIKTADGDDRYAQTDLQVLFGSQPELIQPGLDSLGNFPKDRVVVHVYDRVSSALRNLAREPKTAQEAAQAVIKASQLACHAGYTRFSISGEGAVSNEDPMEDIIDYYATVINGLVSMGATEVNINLANTFGLSPEGQWDQAGLYVFNTAIKAVTAAIPITTSVHTHNDANSATEFALAAVRAGFDRVEGTMIGMGERAGNVAIVDVVTRLLENARSTIETSERICATARMGQIVTMQTLWAERAIPGVIANNLGRWYSAAHRIAAIYGAEDRFAKTSLGNKEAYDAGSGPHAHANESFAKDPVSKPLWRNYAMFALVHAMMGRPEAEQVIQVDPERIRQITLKTHAAGGATNRVLDNLVIASDDDRKASSAMAEQLIADILALCSY